MAQREDVEVESGTRARDSSARRKQGDQHGHRRVGSLSALADKFNGANAYGLFSGHTLQFAPTRL